MSTTPIDFPPNCPQCGWRLHEPMTWWLISVLLSTHKAAGIPRLKAVVDAELARARLAYPEPVQGSQESESSSCSSASQRVYAVDSKTEKRTPGVASGQSQLDGGSNHPPTAVDRR